MSDLVEYLDDILEKEDRELRIVYKDLFEYNIVFDNRDYDRELKGLRKMLKEGLIEKILSMFDEYYELLDDDIGMKCVMTKKFKGALLKFYKGVILDGYIHDGVNVYVIKDLGDIIMRFEIGFLGDCIYIRDFKII